MLDILQSAETQQMLSNSEVIANIFAAVITIGLTIVVFLLRDIKADQKALRDEVHNIRVEIAQISKSDALQSAEMERILERIKILEGT